MKVRVANVIYDETCSLLPNGDLPPASQHASINAAKRAMRRIRPALAFRNYKEIGPKPYEQLAKLTGCHRPEAGVETGPSVASGVAEDKS